MTTRSLFAAAVVSLLLAACGSQPADEQASDAAAVIAAVGDEYAEFAADQSPYVKFHPRAR